MVLTVTPLKWWSMSVGQCKCWAAVLRIMPLVNVARATGASPNSQPTVALRLNSLNHRLSLAGVNHRWTLTMTYRSWGSGMVSPRQPSIRSNSNAAHNLVMCSFFSSQPPWPAAASRCLCQRHLFTFPSRRSSWRTTLSDEGIGYKDIIMKAVIRSEQDLTPLGYGETEQQARRAAAEAEAFRQGAAATEAWHYAGQPAFSGGLVVDMDERLWAAFLKSPQCVPRTKLCDAFGQLTLVLDNGIPGANVVPVSAGKVSINGRQYTYDASQADYAGRPDALCVNVYLEGVAVKHRFIDDIDDMDAGNVLITAKRLIAENEGQIAQYAAEQELGLGFNDDE
ncbi:protein of unknown function [Serratia sp. Tan611]|nr:protein of unknown function [Serratia sp. Tan611]